LPGEVGCGEASLEEEEEEEEEEVPVDAGADRSTDATVARTELDDPEVDV
jgi:hypothetical protein